MEEKELEITETESGEKRKSGKGKTFGMGVIAGLLTATFIFAAIFSGVTLYNKLSLKHAINVNSNLSSVIDDDMVKKAGLIENTIEDYYLNDYDKNQLKEGIYKGMIDGLGDKYSEYFSAEEFKQVMLDTEGIFYGIGAYIAMDPETEICRITEVMDDSPAEAAGLQDLDYIYMVDGVSTQGLESSEVVNMIKGEEGTIVHLTIIRDGEDEPLEYDIARGRVETQSVGYTMLDDNIGYIDIVTFDVVTSDQFTDALVTLKGQGARGIIIDVRSNLGGSMESAIEILRQILPQGLIVYTEDKNGQRDEIYCDGSKELELPLVVLTNQYSASASEILTGAIKDYGKGTIVGTTTYGKGIVQKLIPFTDGSAVKLTTSKYYTPSGVCIHGTGIEPDINVEFDMDAYKKDGTDTQFNAAVDEIHRIWEEE